jgi:hypothetical protein
MVQGNTTAVLGKTRQVVGNLCIAENCSANTNAWFVRCLRSWISLA